MAKESQEGIQTKKEEDIAKWYEEVCLKAKLAEFSPVKGTMIIRPKGYYIWEKIQEYFNKEIVEGTGAENAYFPLFIPESFFKRESEHADDFNLEVAWIDPKVTGTGERLAVRPTSETIMYDSFSKWIRSHRDLPLKINQWSNVVRWETETTKLLLRSREFLWQEGHCVYETNEECEKETRRYIELYQKLCEEVLALPTLIGQKTDKERFAGAEYTYTIEAFMPDGKAVQSGTSHNLGQGFAKAFGISYLGKDENKHLPWQNSWGLSTRLLGGAIMTHSDNKGLVLPPRVVKNKLAIIPILFENSKEQVLEKAEEIKNKLSSYRPILDDREEYSPGWKYSDYELEGIPLRLELGPKDLEKDSVMVVKRNNSEKIQVKIDELEEKIPEVLENMHKELLESAKEILESNIVEVSDWEEFKQAIENRKIVKTLWCGETPCEEEIKEETGGASSRCMPLDQGKVSGKCPHCGNDAITEIYFSKSY
ncbi:MAG: proline--tRNA ligase [Candidatus Pacearchaeota archaeon]